MSFSGCKRPQVHVYFAPRDEAGPGAPAAAAEAQDEARETVRSGPKPELLYALPTGWTKAEANSVSLAAFAIKSGSAEANVNVTPLPNLAGREAMVVNMWREQAGLAPIEKDELEKTLEPVDIGGKKGQMFEVLGAKEGGAPLRIVTAFYHENGASWFFKMSGDEALVTAQKPAFVDFLKSIQVKEPSAPPTETAAPPPAVPVTEFKWKVPDGWKTLAPGNMQVAKFGVPEKDGAKAEVFVSTFPSDTGGTLANVNRWRAQLGLPAVDDAGLKDMASPLDSATPDAVLIDLKNDPRALLGAIVPRDGKWWFYKMLGDAPAVNAARESFVAFARMPPL